MRPQNIITVDWEDWFHICEVDHLLPRDQWDSYPSILPEATATLLTFFKKYNISATFFILGYCADRFPELVQQISNAGHELAYHTQNHQLLYEQTPQQFSKDIAQGKRKLETLSGQTIHGFRAPQWSLNQRCPWGLKQLAKVGYTYDSSRTPLPIIGKPSYPQQVHTLDTTEGTLWEFPPLILNILGIQVPAGGGWGLKTWRLKTIHHKMRQLNQNDSPATFFIHPIDMSDFTPPVQLPLLKRLVTGFGMRRTITSIESLLEITDLISIRQYGNFP